MYPSKFIFLIKKFLVKLLTRSFRSQTFFLVPKWYTPVFLFLICVVRMVKLKSSILFKNFRSFCIHRLITIFLFNPKVDFNLQTKWTEFSFLYLYEMFFKANTLRDDQNFFKPVSQLKTSVIVWYLTNPAPPCHVVGHLTASQVKSIWGITEEELEEMYFDDSGKNVHYFARTRNKMEKNIIDNRTCICHNFGC